MRRTHAIGNLWLVVVVGACGGDAEPPPDPSANGVPCGTPGAWLTCYCPSGAGGYALCDLTTWRTHPCARCGERPSCEWRFCGPDGFGNSCGTCRIGTVCSANGRNCDPAR